MPDSHIDQAVAEGPDERARAALLRISMLALERAEAILGNPHAGVEGAAARLIEAAAHGIEVAIGPIDPPDVASIETAMTSAINKAIEIGHNLAQRQTRGAARYQYVGGAAEDPADRREG